MPTETNAANPVSLGDMARGYFRGKLLCAAVRLGVADALGEGEKNLDELAIATETNSDALYRILRALASIGVVTEVSPARFHLAPFGQPLRRDVPNSVWASIVFWADLLADSWTYLPDCVRTGTKAGAALAMERDGVRSRWSIEPNAHAIFHSAFAEPTVESMAPFVAAYDFSQCRVVADLGGAGGALLAAILVANSQARGILVDRKEAVASAASKLDATGLSGRSEIVPGDLMEAVPQGADVYILKCVLHGYNDEGARRILQNCRSAMSSSSRLLIIEVVLPTTVANADPRLEQMLMGDINMLAVTGGRERNEVEWTSLVRSAGYELSGITPIPGQTSSIIESVPRG